MVNRPGQKQVRVLGHSFVRQMKEYIDKDSYRTYCNLNLPVAKFKVRFEGYGGWRIPDIRTWLPPMLGDKPLDVIYVEMGSNDLCHCDDAGVVAKHLVSFADYLCESHGVKSVYLGQCLRRYPSKANAKNGLSGLHLQRYNVSVNVFNKELSLRCSSIESGKVHYWRHRGGFWGPGCHRLFHSDGIHLNRLGMKRYINSVRHAILHANNHI